MPSSSFVSTRACTPRRARERRDELVGVARLAAGSGEEDVERRDALPPAPRLGHLADRLRGGRDVDGGDGAEALDLLAEREAHLLPCRAGRDRPGSALATSSRVVFEPTSMTPIRISTHPRSAIGGRRKRSGDEPETDW